MKYVGQTNIAVESLRHNTLGINTSANRTFGQDKLRLLDIRQPQTRIGGSARLNFLRPKLREQISKILRRCDCHIRQLIDEDITFIRVSHRIEITLHRAKKRPLNKTVSIR